MYIKPKKEGFPFFGIICVAVMLSMVWGWGQNIYKFASCDFEPSYKAELIHGIGIFVPPLGAIVGYMDLED